MEDFPERKWLSLYRKAIKIMKAEYLPFWQRLGFEVQFREKPEELEVTLKYNGRIVDLLVVQLRQVKIDGRNYPVAIDVKCMGEKETYPIENPSEDKLWNLRCGAETFTRAAVMKAAARESAKRLGRFLFFNKQAFRLELKDDVYFEFYFDDPYHWVWEAYRRKVNGVWWESGRIVRPIGDDAVEAFLNFFQAVMLQMTL